MNGWTIRTRAERQAAVERYLEARAEFDEYTERVEEDRAAGRAFMPTTEADDAEYQRLNEAFNNAMAAAPWWARFRWS